jgi:3-deoxy-D-manno-octulosonate 8-phosphate phosphatase (KDO 8-P phosphatase)
VFQGVDDKLAVFRKLVKSEKLTPESAGFMGDELVDVPVLEQCGFACAPREAPQAVRRRVHYITTAPAGRGAVRELCDLLVRAR